MLCHQCDFVGCVNPQHMRLGTNAVNRIEVRIRDAEAEGLPLTFVEEQWQRLTTGVEEQRLSVGRPDQSLAPKVVAMSSAVWVRAVTSLGSTVRLCASARHATPKNES
ncbi:hypothetical protein FXW78_14090 [Rhodococcus opacus]|nr:hypothetical protein [Rhodococcus opacus]